MVTAQFRGTWQELPALDLPPVTAVLAATHTEALRAVKTCTAGGVELLLVAAGRVNGPARQQLLDDGFAVWQDGVVSPPTAARPPEPGRVWLLTSGSTGRPKRVAHTLASLTTVTGPQPDRTWLAPYSVGAYAWWQLVTLGLSGQDLVFVEPSQLDGWPALAAAEGVTAASGTPTFWRRALWQDAEAVARVPLRQATLGGEPVDQPVLDQLKAAFPQARVSWIYASSEAGAAIAVHDGRAGFPVAWLDREAPGRPLLKVVDGELVLRSPHAASGLPADLRTGDRADVVDGRVLVTGRLATDEINVGGSKASASAVRDVLQSHPDVQWALVKGRKAPLVGTLVQADVVLRSPVAEAELHAWCSARLPDYAVPTRFRVLDAVPLKETLKSDV